MMAGQCSIKDAITMAGQCSFYDSSMNHLLQDREHHS